MKYICIRSLAAHTGKKYKKDDTISDREYNSLTYREKTEHFLMVLKPKEVEGIENDYNCEL